MAGEVQAHSGHLVAECVAERVHGLEHKRIHAAVGHAERGRLLSAARLDGLFDP